MPGAPLNSIFHIQQRHRIWHVLVDGAFFGDYRSKSLALDSVEEAKRALEQSGRSVKVVTAPDEAP